MQTRHSDSGSSRDGLLAYVERLGPASTAGFLEELAVAVGG